MSKPLLMLNALLVVAAVVFGGMIARDLSSAPARPAARPVAAAPVAVPPTTAPAVGPDSYAVVASRNLFSPTRSEAPPTTGVAGSPPALPKPNLYGVVLRDGAPIAYLEDPVTKRVAGYRVGDAIAGGTLRTISADRVVLARPEGMVDVKLHDPTRPRPAAPPLPAAAGGALPRPQAVNGQPPAPEAAMTPPPTINGRPAPLPLRRPLPPNLLRRLPQAPASDATRR